MAKMWKSKGKSPSLLINCDLINSLNQSLTTNKHTRSSHKSCNIDKIDPINFNLELQAPKDGENVKVWRKIAIFVN